MGEGDCGHSSRPDQPKAWDHTTSVPRGQDTQPGTRLAALAPSQKGEARLRLVSPDQLTAEATHRLCTVSVTADGLLLSS